MHINRLWWSLLLAYGLGLIGLGYWFRHALNADAVAYLRIAHYYSTGQWELAVSGYWGPLASWVIAPFLKLGVEPLLVGRGFMAVSALVFLLGCRAVYRSFGLSGAWQHAGLLMAGLASLYWSVQFITPDLLLSGLIGLSLSRMVAAEVSQSRSTAFCAGLVWGVAYLTKAVAFPLALSVTLGHALLVSWRQPMNRKSMTCSAALTLLGFALVAGPWVAVLSLKYQTPTFSTTAQISHTLTGPQDVERYHPLARTFHRPAPGRITSWEEPSGMAYRPWSPLESPAYAWHQLKVIGRNLTTCLALVTSLNAGWLALFFALPLCVMRKRNWKELAGDYGQVLLVPALMTAIYLPCYVTLTEQRFFYAAFPFLFVAMALWATRQSAASRTPASLPAEPRPLPMKPPCGPERAWWRLAVLGSLLPILAAAAVIGTMPKMAGDCAAEIALRIQGAKLAGPIAGSAMRPGGRVGLYVAFLLGQPWFGDEIQPNLEHLKASGARLVMAVRDSPFAGRLDNEPGFDNLDRRLFGSPAEASRWPVKVYELTLQSPSASLRE